MNIHKIYDMYPLLYFAVLHKLLNRSRHRKRVFKQQIIESTIEIGFAFSN